MALDRNTSDGERRDKNYFNELARRAYVGSHSTSVIILEESGTLYAYARDGTEIAQEAQSGSNHSILASAIQHTQDNAGGRVHIAADLTLTTQISKTITETLTLEALDNATVDVQVDNALKLEGEQQATTDFNGSANRGDTTISLNSVSGISQGDLIEFVTDRTVESVRGIQGGETTIVRSVNASTNEVTIAEPLAFDYNPSGEATSVTAYDSGQVTLRNIDLTITNGGDFVAFRLLQLQDPRVHGMTAVGETEHAPHTAIQLRVCHGTRIEGLDVEKLRYGVLVTVRCSDTEVEGVHAVQVRHAVGTGDVVRFTTARRVFGRACVGTVDAHQGALHTSYERVVGLGETEGSNARGLGVTLDDVYLEGTGPTGNFLVSDAEYEASVEDGTHDVHIDNLTIEWPNAGDFRMDEGHDVYLSGVSAPGLRLVALSNIRGEMHLSNCRFDQLSPRIPTRGVNVTVDRGGATGACIESPDDRLHLINSELGDADAIVDDDTEASKKVRFTACRLHNVTDFGTNWGFSTAYDYRFVACDLENITNSFSSPQLDDALASANEYPSTSDRLDNEHATVRESATLDFGSVASGATAEKTISVSEAETGDEVNVGAPSGIESGLTWNGYVSSSGTVTIRVHNTTGSSIDPASATWSVEVSQ